MQYRQKTDAELVVLLTLNDEEAFSELYVRYKSKLQYFCFHFLKVESEACDIVQEVFIRIWESRCFINPELSFFFLSLCYGSESCIELFQTY